jgi:hypothetical protein
MENHNELKIGNAYAVLDYIKDHKKSIKYYSISAAKTIGFSIGAMIAVHFIGSGIESVVNDESLYKTVSEFHGLKGIVTCNSASLFLFEGIRAYFLKGDPYFPGGLFE